MIEVKKEYYDNENIYSESYWLNGEIHREDGPAYIAYDRDGSISFKEYYFNGNLHRKDGPAYIGYYNNGNIYRQLYYKNGKLHREDGPAEIIHYYYGDVKYKYYWLNDFHLTEQEWFNQLSIENKLKFTFGVNND